jgi:hypothetical protein
MPDGQRQQKQPAGRVVGGHGGTVDVEQLQAVQEQPGERGGRPVRAVGQRAEFRRLAVRVLTAREPTAWSASATPAG